MNLLVQLYRQRGRRSCSRRWRADLNRVIQSGPLYEAQRFANVTLSPKTMRMLERTAARAWISCG